ncbi:MAG: KpsF/GutQ family sugar-phosphate isomerase [Hungatella sp.]|nr:KpsF/GutQ family sugar-phosphate isomerase [Hungatella sp.]
MDILAEGKRVFDYELEAVRKTRDALDGTFIQIIQLITECSGKVIVTGMGKSGHIAAKIAATFASLGTSSFYLHPGEAMHGDLGMVSRKDIVIAISYSGESDEIIAIIPNIKLIGAVLIGITGNRDSTLAKASDFLQVLPEFQEACYLGLAPTSSTSAVLSYGDALAVVASGLYGFKDTDFGKYHPAGALGKKLILKVDDIMVKDEDNAMVMAGSMLKDAIVELSKKGLGLVSVVDEYQRLQGVITDGDLRRQLEKGVNVYDLRVDEIMTKNPVSISSKRLAVDALKLMRDKNISGMPVLDFEKVIGCVRLQAVIHAGIIG